MFGWSYGGPRLRLDRLYSATFAALLLGTLGAILAAARAKPGDWSDGLRWGLFAVASGIIAAIIGLIFGVPRARPEFRPAATERYESNSALEQISDWLTKLLVGASLVSLKSVPGSLGDLGGYLGGGLKIKDSGPYAISAVLYGAGVGFFVGYLWARLKLRYLLELGDNDAADASKRDVALAALKQVPEIAADPALNKLVDTAVKRTTEADEHEWLPILWVDDHPSNNIGIVRALTALGITVESVVSTTDAVNRLNAGSYALIISDLGRTEDGADNPMAGRDLLGHIRELQIATPVIIYAGPRGMQNQQVLLDAGARRVTQSPSEVFEQAVLAVTGAPAPPASV